MHDFKHVVRWFALIFMMSVMGLHAQAPKVADCITGMDGSCRGLAIRQVSQTNAVNTVRITAPNVPRTLAFTTTCSGAGTAAVTVTVATEQTYANPLTIDTLTALATNTKQYDVATLGGVTMVSPLVFPYIQISVATCGVGNTSTLSVALKGL